MSTFAKLDAAFQNLLTATTNALADVLLARDSAPGTTLSDDTALPEGGLVQLVAAADAHRLAALDEAAAAATARDDAQTAAGRLGTFQDVLDAAVYPGGNSEIGIWSTETTPTGYAVGPIPVADLPATFGAAQVFIKPHNAAELPTVVRVQIRDGGSAVDVAPVLAQSGLVDLGAPAVGEVVSPIVALDQTITSADHAAGVYVVYLTDGRTGQAAETGGTTPYGRAWVVGGDTDGTSTWSTGSDVGGVVRLGTIRELYTPAASVSDALGDTGSAVRLRAAEAAAARVTEGEGPMVVLALGDSITNAESRYLRQFRDRLAARIDPTAAIEQAGPGWVSAMTGNPPPVGAGLVSAGWTRHDQTADARGIDVAHATADAIGSTQSYSSEMTTAVIHYYERAGGVGLRYRIDGGGWSDLPGTGSAGLRTHTTVTLADAGHVIEIEATEAGAVLCGVDLRRDVPGLRVLKAGNSGATAVQHANIDAADALAGYAATEADVVLVALFANDWSQDPGTAVSAAALGTILDRLRVALPMADLVVCGPAGGDESAPQLDGAGDLSAYVAAARSVATDRGAAFVDWLDVVGPFTEANARGLFDDHIHPTARGGAVLGRAIAAAVL